MADIWTGVEGKVSGVTNTLVESPKEEDEEKEENEEKDWMEEEPDDVFSDGSWPVFFDVSDAVLVLQEGSKIRTKKLTELYEHIEKVAARVKKRFGPLAWHFDATEQRCVFLQNPRLSLVPVMQRILEDMKNAGHCPQDLSHINVLRSQTLANPCKPLSGFNVQCLPCAPSSIPQVAGGPPPITGRVWRRQAGETAAPCPSHNYLRYLAWQCLREFLADSVSDLPKRAPDQKPQSLKLSLGTESANGSPETNTGGPISRKSMAQDKKALEMSLTQLTDESWGKDTATKMDEVTTDIIGFYGSYRAQVQARKAHMADPENRRAVMRSAGIDLHALHPELQEKLNLPLDRDLPDVQLQQELQNDLKEPKPSAGKKAVSRVLRLLHAGTVPLKQDLKKESPARALSSELEAPAAMAPSQKTRQAAYLPLHPT
ncbi:unnamed protein product [Polarella glacialis]|uniref:Uncharacterized protein n=1 Tax=Polarella glacialis TaxID=89957 RepID=A0A813JVV0_POLGL|nr:unnamed protein product [Polarella glacialis]